MFDSIGDSISPWFTPILCSLKSRFKNPPVFKKSEIRFMIFVSFMCFCKICSSFEWFTDSKKSFTSAFSIQQSFSFMKLLALFMAL